MKAQEILESITQHRAQGVAAPLHPEMARKVEEIEWALQALAEKCVELEENGARPI